MYIIHFLKSRTDASIYQQLFMEIRDRYRDYIPVYTDSPVNLAHFGVQPATNCNRDETTCNHSGKGPQTTY